MREIKFRAWLKDEKRMVNVISIDFQNKEIGFAPIETDFNAFSKIDDYYAVLETKSFDKVELMQFTGTSDANDDTEIYEGDIIEYLYGSNCKRRDVVKYDSYFARFVLYHENNDPLKVYMLDFQQLNLFAHDYKAIGNIYENPELLEEVEE